MSGDKTQPIIVKRRKKHHEAHHGGSWKVAYADFVTAMMAFFLLMWLLGSTTKPVQEQIAKFFQSPSAIQAAGGSSTSMINMGGMMDMQQDQGESVNKTFPDVAVTDASDIMQRADQMEREKERERLKGEERQREHQRLEELRVQLQDQIQASQALKPFKDQLLIDITAEGLRIQIVDKENRPMFDLGGAHLKDYTVGILHELAKSLNTVPNRISLTGHTDARLYPGQNPAYSNWELSADRANAARRELLKGGLEREKLSRVVGLGETVFFDKLNPNNPINRRIAIIVLKKEVQEAIVRSAEGLQAQLPLINLPDIQPP